MSKDFKHLTQIHLKGKLNKIISDDLFVKQVRDSRRRTYFRAILSDSKLSKNSPWTTNQKEELINAFKNTDKPYLEFEVRSTLDKLPVNSPVKTQDKIRLYKEDLYKIISDGDGNFKEVLDYKEILK